MDSVTRSTFEADVVAASHVQPVLVDIWGPRCAPCLAMMPMVEQLADSQADALRIVKLNSAEDRQLCFDLRVMGLPTFLFYENGEEVWRLSGDSADIPALRDKLGLS
jgi:thioredoxin 1